MAYCEMNKTVNFKLTLSDDEARWLIELLQNPLYRKRPIVEVEIETDRDRMFRQSLWNVLARARSS